MFRILPSSPPTSTREVRPSKPSTNLQDSLGDNGVKFLHRTLEKLAESAFFAYAFNNIHPMTPLAGMASFIPLLLAKYENEKYQTLLIVLFSPIITHEQ